MAWKESCALEEGTKFVLECSKDEWTMAELCEEYGISRPTGYKWWRRYQRGGLEALAELDRAPRRHPNATGADVEKLILAARQAHGRWGPRKLRAWLAAKQPERRWPATSTIGALLRREGLTVPQRRKRRTPPYSEPFQSVQESNAVWCIDFKGWFRTQDGERCEPLTISDGWSRYLLRCQAVAGPNGEQVRALMEAAFREYGLPGAIRSDNGSPFAGRGLGGLSRLSVWWIKLGIAPERIAPGRPDQNGRHERMHRTLKAETAQPPKANRREQQHAFDRFRTEYNEERPHEALDYRTPASLYTVSPRPYPARVPTIEYPDGVIVRRVQPRGQISWKHREVFISEALALEWVGLELIDDWHYRIYFGPIELGTFDEKQLKIRPAVPARTVTKLSWGVSCRPREARNQATSVASVWAHQTGGRSVARALWGPPGSPTPGLPSGPHSAILGHAVK
ncbi:MAG: IS481 family transposase [Acidobacteria bacterium]|nr:IS481 family transposase [Acidobacteriota bacterium]